MAYPSTLDNVWTRLGFCVTLWNEIEKFGNANTGNYKTLYEAIVPETEGEWLPNALKPLKTQRQTFASLISPATIKAVGAHYIDEFGEVLNFSGNRNQVILKVRQSMAENSPADTINGREMVFGSITADGGNTGDGVVHRVSVDEYGYPIENVWPGNFEMRCTTDQLRTTKHQEVFDFMSGKRDPDEITRTDPGIHKTIRAVSDADVVSYLKNPSFDTSSGSGATLAFDGWTLSDASLFAEVATNFKTRDGVTGQSLKFTADANVYQTPVSEFGGTYQLSRPFLFDFAMYRDSSATGTMTVQLGSQTRAITIGSQSDDAWTRFTVPGTIGQNSWVKNWGEDTPTIKFTLSSLAVGTVYIDDIVFYPMGLLAGHFFLPVGGATAWLESDKFTWTVADGGTRAKFAYWCWRMGWPNIPSATGGGETISDPSDPS